MFNKKAMKFSTTMVLYGVIGLFFLLSCSDDEPNFKQVIEGREGDCFDGILNGDEVIVDCGGVCPGFCPPNSIGVLGGEVRGIPLEQDQVAPLQLNPTIEYRLIGPLLVRDGARLSIPAGTVIKVDPNAGAYIAVAQGGSLLISGQPDNPVIITSGAENPAPGDWGGIIVCGDGPIASGEVGRTDIIDIFYGGSDVENSSGSINYLRIEYAGALAENGQKFDALALYGVGAFTAITNVQTFESLGNGIRFIGGNANAKQLVSTNSGGNALVIQDDWSGNGASWYLSGISKAGIKITTDQNIESVQPIATDTIANISIVGPAPEGGLHYTDGGGKYDVSNMYTSNMTLGINVDGSTANEQIALGNLKIDSVQFDNPAAGFIPTNYSGVNNTFYLENNTSGAENKASAPGWAKGWTIGFE
jgi:hypothetical protein